MRVERLFTVLVVQGAVLAGCDPGALDPGDRQQAQGDTDVADTDVADTDASDTDVLDTDACADAVCENTDSWVDCLGDGVTCCWATGECCDFCCGHLSP